MFFFRQRLIYTEGPDWRGARHGQPTSQLRDTSDGRGQIQCFSAGSTLYGASEGASARSHGCCVIHYGGAWRPGWTGPAWSVRRRVVLRASPVDAAGNETLSVGGWWVLVPPWPSAPALYATGGYYNSTFPDRPGGRLIWRKPVGDTCCARRSSLHLDAGQVYSIVNVSGMACRIPVADVHCILFV